ncbi:hypothetical protein [Allostreptomyces psammosilenae]|uniref:DUF8175 domain-containing protein n=1 Tax=Allostreptomyces psammosilenae TaxID=1892865 RepID=A0A853AAF8_9ACTN|nr:hypothetical protein [Allostreptomyces psammosilenae]NYI07498.1 hypothetical protein [Allostreptomyces psammosilenae]
MPVTDDQPNTRTRLPAEPGAPAVPPRAHPVRSLLTVIGVVVLLLGAVAVAGRLDGQGGDTPASADGDGSGTPATNPTAPTGTAPVAAGADGIAVGHPQTEQGAQSAAANYVVALGSDRMFATDTRHAIVVALTAPEQVDDWQARLDDTYAALASQYGLDDQGASTDEDLTFVCRTIPVGTRVEEYTPERAVVSVWNTGLIGLAGEGSTQPVTESWATTTLTLEWQGGDWLISDQRQEEGPVPISGIQPASGAEEIAEAISEFGGFSYAR